MSNELIEAGYSDAPIATREGHIGNSLLSKENFNHYMNVADFLSKSSMVPKGMQGKASDILIAMEMGLQIGIPMMQAIQDIAVINGKPCMYGDGLLAVVQGHKDYEWIDEKIERDSKNQVLGALCVIKRRNHEPHAVPFTVDDAKKANLWGKPGPWSQYPERMLQMRARGFCIRDTFSDALRGIKADEEVNDYQVESQPASKQKKSDALMNKINSAKNQVIDITPTEVTQETGEAVSEELLNEIGALLSVKEFGDKRVEASMKYYKVENLGQLTKEQALDFIKNLNKVADK